LNSSFFKQVEFIVTQANREHNMSAQFLSYGLPNFLLHFGAAIALLLLFISIYIRITPYKEIALIRAGNSAAAASLSGAVLGYCVALASSIAHSVNIFDMLCWGGIGLLIQLLAFFICRMMLPDLVKDVPENKIASGVFLGAISLGMGILNAACQTY
jgi:putative membrane protein